MLLFQLVEQHLRRAVYHRVPLFRRLPGDGQGGVGLAHPRRPPQQQIVRPRREIGGVLPAVRQYLLHPLAGRHPRCRIGRVGVIGEIHLLEGGQLHGRHPAEPPA